MGRFWTSSSDRGEKPQAKLAPKCERLNRLDRELMQEKTKDFDYLYAIRDGLRIKICVMRDEDNHCFATATLGKQSFRCGGGYSPSGAYLILSVALRVHLASLTQAERDLLLAGQSIKRKAGWRV